MLKTILNRPVAVVTVFIVIVAASVLMTLGIPLDLYPEIDMPIMAVTISYSGAAPEEVEEEVVRVVEGELSGLDGLDTMESTSSENFGLIVLTMNYGTDLDETMAEVRTRLDRVAPSLPVDAEDPVLQKFDPSSMPILSLVFSGDRGEKELQQIAENDVIPVLEALEGVAGVSLSGIRESIVRADVDQVSLESFGLTLTGISRSLSSQNLQLGAGSFEEDGTDILIRSSGRFEDLEELGRTVIMTVPSADGGPGTNILLSDIADISWGFADADTLVRIDGEPGISLQIQKGSEDNSVAVADGVKAALVAVNAGLPDGVEVSLLTDSTGNVRNNLSQVTSAALLGILFAVIVLMFFLRQWKSTLIAALSIPIALTITLAGLAVTGRTLNLVTLVGLSMGVGLIVDSSIVVIENIFRLRQKGAPMKVAAFRGAGEVMPAITASTLTTIAVFLPLLIYKNDLGFIGTFFGELSFIIIMALISSLVVAVILVPVLSSRFLTIHTREEKPIRSRFLRRIDGSLERGLEKLENGYARFLRGAVRRQGLTISLAVLVLLGSFMLLGGLEVSMMPPVPESSLTMEAEFPTGTAIGETEQVMRDIQDRVGRELENSDRIVMNAEKGAGSLEITFVEEAHADAEVKVAKGRLRHILEDYPALEFSFTGSDHAAAMRSSGVDVAITGSDWESMQLAAGEIAALMKSVEGIDEVDNGAVRGLPQVEIVFDRQGMYEQGLNAAAVAREVRALTAGTTATTFLEGGESYDVVLRLADGDRSSVSDLERLFVVNSTGDRVSLAQIARIERSSGPTTVTRENRVRTVHVVGTLADGAAPRSVTRDVRNLLDGGSLDIPGVSWHVGGEMDDFAETGSAMLMVFILAALLVVAVMVAQFESFKDPLIIFLAMPMMLIGIFAVFSLTGTTMSMIAFMGIILLVGIVVNNGIVLVDHARLLRRRGMGVVEAAVESGRSRLKPVLMTSLTTILAMTPMAFFPGEGGQMMQPMGLAVVGGLSTAMIGTLVMVPVFYTIAHRRERDDYRTRRQRKEGKAAAGSADPEGARAASAVTTAAIAVTGTVTRTVTEEAN